MWIVSTLNIKALVKNLSSVLARTQSDKFEWRSWLHSHCRKLSSTSACYHDNPPNFCIVDNDMNVYRAISSKRVIGRCWGMKMVWNRITGFSTIHKFTHTIFLTSLVLSDSCDYSISQSTSIVKTRLFVHLRYACVQLQPLIYAVDVRSSRWYLFRLVE